MPAQSKGNRGRKVQTVDEYLKSFPPDVQKILNKARRAVLKAAPGSEEVISYQIIAFKVDGQRLVYLGGWKHHVGLYPIPVFEPDLEEQVSPYRASKDTLRFPFRKPIPYDLIERVVARLTSRSEGGSLERAEGGSPETRQTRRQVPTYHVPGTTYH